MEELEKKEPKSEKRGNTTLIWLYLMFMWLITLSFYGMNMYSNLTQIQHRLSILEAQDEIVKVPRNVIYLQDTGNKINGYPEVSCGKFSFTSYVDIQDARKNAVFLETIYSQSYFKFSCENENEPYSQVNLILPNGEEFEISVEDGKAQVVIPLFEPGIYVVETFFESQEEPRYLVFQWKRKAQTEIIML